VRRKLKFTESLAEYLIGRPALQDKFEWSLTQ
jgi:hypothetical protein